MEHENFSKQQSPGLLEKEFDKGATISVGVCWSCIAHELMAWNRGIKLWRWIWALINFCEFLGAAVVGWAEVTEKARTGWVPAPWAGGLRMQHTGMRSKARREDVTPTFLPWDHEKWSGASSRLLHLLAGAEHPSSRCCAKPLSPCTPLQMSQLSQHQLCRAVLRGESGYPPTPVFPDTPH